MQGNCDMNALFNLCPRIRMSTGRDNVKFLQKISQVDGQQRQSRMPDAIHGTSVHHLFDVWPFLSPTLSPPSISGAPV